MNARYYDPHLGSFITPDPAMSGLNHYAYCSANPIKYTDPTGLSDDEQYDNYLSGIEAVENSIEIANGDLNPAAATQAESMGSGGPVAGVETSKSPDRDGDGKVEPWEEFYNKWDASIAEFNRRCNEIAANLDERDANFAAGLGWKTDEQLGIGGGKAGLGSGLDGVGGGKNSANSKYFNRNDLNLSQKLALFFSFMGLSPIKKSEISAIVQGGLFQQVINWSARAGLPHSGIDLACINGTRVNSVIDGIVSRVQYNQGGYEGWLVTVSNGFGIYTHYAHMTSVNVKEGDFVFGGITTIGFTGYGHLHFEVSINGFYNNFVNPLDILPNWTASKYTGNKGDIRY